MKKLLHISYDFSDKKNTAKTSAVGDLAAQGAKLIPSKVISLDRILNPRNETAEVSPEGYLILKVFGLPYGIFLKWHLKRVYNKILKAAEEGKIDLSDIAAIHAHKLTFEGYTSYLLAKKLNARLFISLRQTDFRILRVRPDLRKYFREALKFSSIIFYIVPSMIDKIKGRMGEDFFSKEIESKLMSLPNRIIIENENYNYQPVKGLLMTALRIDRRSVKRKRIKNLFIAFSMINYQDIKLQIIGDGPYKKKLEKWAIKYGIQNKIEFAGSINHPEINKNYQQAEAFLLPSFSETFGLVYGEALLNGTPILYTKGTGFDGFFENIGPKVDPDSPESIAEGIRDVLERNEFYRETINKLKAENGFFIFSPEYSLHIYEEALSRSGIIELKKDLTN
jgi:glycosyltransferase involved in cell wall biosynthesis